MIFECSIFWRQLIELIKLDLFILYFRTLKIGRNLLKIANSATETASDIAGDNQIRRRQPRALKKLKIKNKYFWQRFFCNRANQKRI